MIKETWMIIGQTFLFLILVFLVLGIIITVCIFFHKIWEFINTEQGGSVGIIKGNVTIVPNEKGEIYVGNLTLYEGFSIKGAGVDKTTVKTEEQ